MREKIKYVAISLFDGMSCGHIAFDRTDLNIVAYYASEIKPYALKVSGKNYPDTIQLGDITKIDFKQLLKDIKAKYGEDIKIIFIGGSPCQGFSFAGKQLNFSDPRSRLFFNYIDAKNILKPDYFFLENTNMKQVFQDIISDNIGVKPIRINSTLVSATTRDRLYWSNIEGVSAPENKNISFNDIRDEVVDESLFIPSKYTINFNDKISKNTDKTIRLGGYMKQGQGQRVYSMDGKSVCLSALGGGWGAKTGLYLDGERSRKPTIKELCRLQTVPEDYFEGLGLSYANIAELVGDGWTVDVIAHFFKQIPVS